MNIKTLLLYLAMYIYGFGLTLWAIYFDKRPTRRSRNGAIFGFWALILTLFYVGYVIWKFGII